MLHNLHSQSHVLNMALLHCQHIHFSHVGKAGLLMPAPQLVSPSPPPISLYFVMNRQDMEFQESTICFLLEPAAGPWGRHWPSRSLWPVDLWPVGRSAGEAQQLLLPCGHREARGVGVGSSRGLWVGTVRGWGCLIEEGRQLGLSLSRSLRPETSACGVTRLSPECVPRNGLIFCLLLYLRYHFPSGEIRHRNL